MSSALSRWAWGIAVALPFLVGAETPGLTSDPLTTLIQYGVLGMVVLGFITGWIVPGPQAKQLIEENKRLNVLVENKLLPMSEQYAKSMERSSIVIENATNALELAASELRTRVAGDRGRG